MPPTGNAEIDAEEAKSINLMSIDLDLKKDHSYIERIRKTTIEGTWSAGNHTVTLLPRSINGIDAAAVKRQMDEAAARHNLKMPDMPGMAGPEQLALSSDSKSLSVPTIGQTVILQRAEQ
jgi:hypothetical protein